MAAEIRTINQTIGVSNIGTTALTEIEQDPATGFFVRELRIYEANNDGSTGKLVLTVRMESATREGVTQRTPQLTF